MNEQIEVQIMFQKYHSWVIYVDYINIIWNAMHKNIISNLHER